MTTEHSDVITALARRLFAQLEEQEYKVSVNLARLRISTGFFYIPDVCVIPRSVVRHKRQETPRGVEIYSEPLPLVVDVWSPSTGEYDVETKPREYQLRSDEEVWRIHPYERTLIAWRRQADGSYSEALYERGAVQAVALPHVTIELAGLFE